MLQFMGFQRVGHDWATELNWTELNGWIILSLGTPSSLSIYLCSAFRLLLCPVYGPSAPVIIGLQMSFQILVFSVSTPRFGIAGFYGTSLLSFLEEPSYSLPNGCTDLHSHQECRGVPFSLNPLQPGLLELLWDGHCDGGEVIVHWNFDLPSSNH